MKNLILIFVFVSLSLVIIAQEKVEVTVIEKEMSQGTQVGFVVIVPEAGIDFVENRWKKYANDRSIIENIAKGSPGRLVENTYKTIANAISPDKDLEKNRQKLRVVKENDEFVVRGIVHKHVTQQLLDIYARIVQLEHGTQVSAFFRYSDSVFIDQSNADEETIISIKNYMYGFGVETYRKEVENQIDDQKKELRKLNTVLDNLVSKNESFEKSISRAESEIISIESEISLNNEQLPRATRLVSDTRKQMLGQKKNSVEYESLKETLKEREKDKKKIINQNKNLRTKIKQQEFRIKKALGEIANNEKGQQMQQSVIEKQEQVILGLETKLGNIK